MHRGKHSSALAFPMDADRAFRRRIAMAVEQLIAVLDTMDGDPDLEPEPDDEDSYDRELDPAEDGIADQDALQYFFAELARRTRRYVR